MKTNVLERLALGMAICASSLGYAQVNVSVDHSRWASVPLEKKYGVNIPFDVSMGDLEKNISAIEDLQLRVVRVHNGWGMEGEGKLVETSPITFDGDKLQYDFATMDKLLGLIQATGAKPTLVNGYGPQVLTGQFNTMPEDKLELWGELNKLVADHVQELGIPVDMEVWDNASDKTYFNGDATAYTALLGPAFKGLQGHDYVKVAYGGIEDWNLWGWREPWNSTDWKQIPKYISSVWINTECIDHHLYEATGLAEQLNPIDDYYEGQVSSFSMFGKGSADAVSAKAAVAFYESIRKLATGWTNAENVNFGPAGAKITKVFLDQLMDDNQGNKGLISKDGVKSPLYFALKLYNEMPVDGKELISDNTVAVQGFASSNASLAAVALWNNSDAEQTVALTQSGLSFTPDKIEIYRIDDAHSSDGELAVETLADMPASLTLPVNGLVVVKMAASGDTSMQRKDFASFNKTQERTWFSWTEGWAWQSIYDPFTASTVMGVVKDHQYGVAYKTAYLEDIPQRIRVKITSYGGPMVYMDENTACYVRVDFESEDEYGAYYQSKNVFYDESNTYLFDASHGSQIDFSSPENNWVGVDFTNPDGFVIDVADFNVPDYNGNAAIYFYLQNPGTGAESDFIVKFELEDAGADSGIADVKDEKGIVSVYPTRVQDYVYVDMQEERTSSVQIFNVEGKVVLETALDGDGRIALPQLARGSYFVRVSNAGGCQTTKIVK